MTGENCIADAEQKGGPSSEEYAQPSGGQPALGVGGCLKAAREAKGLSLAEVARTLKLSVHQIESMEADEWSRLPCTTIIRGFVRNYARLVNVDSEPLMQQLGAARLPESPQLQMPTGTPVRMGDERRVDRRDYVRIVAGLVILLCALGTYFFLPDELLRSTVEAVKAATRSKTTESDEASGRSKDAPPEAAEKAADKAAEASRTLVPSPVVLAEPSPVPQSASPVNSPVPAAPAQAAPLAAPAGGDALRFAFSKPSWVEVRDKTGQIIFSQLSPGGTERVVEGTPPFAVVVGNAGFVTLTYKGQNIDLSKRSKDDVARLNLD